MQNYFFATCFRLDTPRSIRWTIYKNQSVKMCAAPEQNLGGPYVGNHRMREQMRSAFRALPHMLGVLQWTLLPCLLTYKTTYFSKSRRSKSGFSQIRESRPGGASYLPLWKENTNVRNNNACLSSEDVGGISCSLQNVMTSERDQPLITAVLKR